MLAFIYKICKNAKEKAHYIYWRWGQKMNDAEKFPTDEEIEDIINAIQKLNPLNKNVDALRHFLVGWLTKQDDEIPHIPAREVPEEEKEFIASVFRKYNNRHMTSFMLGISYGEVVCATAKTDKVIMMANIIKECHGDIHKASKVSGVSILEILTIISS